MYVTKYNIKYVSKYIKKIFQMEENKDGELLSKGIKYRDKSIKYL